MTEVVHSVALQSAMVEDTSHNSAQHHYFALLHIDLHHRRHLLHKRTMTLTYLALWIRHKSTEYCNTSRNAINYLCEKSQNCSY